MQKNPNVEKWRKVVEAACNLYNFPSPTIILAQIDLESAGNESAISEPTDPSDPSTVGVGLGQITPKYNIDQFMSWQEAEKALLNPFYNIYRMVNIMSGLLSKYDSLVIALETYNTGNPDAVDKTYALSVLLRTPYY